MLCLNFQRRELATFVKGHWIAGCNMSITPGLKIPAICGMPCFEYGRMHRKFSHPWKVLIIKYHPSNTRFSLSILDCLSPWQPDESGGLVWKFWTLVSINGTKLVVIVCQIFLALYQQAITLIAGNGCRESITAVPWDFSWVKNLSLTIEICLPN